MAHQNTLLTNLRARPVHPGTRAVSGLLFSDATVMAPVTRKRKRESHPSTAVAEKQYSHMEVYGQAQAHFGDRIYQGGQHTYHHYAANVPQNPLAPTRPFNSLPWPKDPDFVGRQDALDNMKCSLDATGSIALTGPGGVGKSQTALEYCWRFSADHPEFHVFWIYAGTIARFDADYRQLARRIGVDCHDGIPTSAVRGGVKDWLNTNDKWLMVIDNADSYSDFFGVEGNDEGDLIQTALPWPRPSEAMMVYTSRHARIGAQLTAQDCLQLEVMSESDGIALFRRKFRRPLSNDETVRLLTALEFLPLSIAHAAAYLNFTEIPVDAYLSRIEGSDEGLLDMLGQTVDVGRQAYTSVVTTWKASFNLIRKHNRAAADLFCFIACLERQNIPEDLISVITDSEFAQMIEARRQQGFDIMLPLTQGDRWTALAELSSLALLTRGCAMGGSKLSLHRYVRATTIRHLKDEGNLLPFSLSAAEGLIIALQSDSKKLKLIASCEGSGNDWETQLSSLSIVPHVFPLVVSVHALLGVTSETREYYVLQYGYQVTLFLHLYQFVLYRVLICCKQYGIECLAGIDSTDFINIEASCNRQVQRLREIQCLYSEARANCTPSHQRLRRPKKKRSAGNATTTHSLPDQ